MGRRKERPGILQTRENAGGLGDSHARSGDAHLPRQAVAAPAIARRRTSHRRSSRTHEDAVPRPGHRSATFLRSTLGSLLLYAARVAPEIAHSIDDVDRAMRWGFGWELGPFEIWDAIGVREVLAATSAGDPPPDRWPTCCAPGATASATVRCRRRSPIVSCSPVRKHVDAIVKKNAGASLVDLGDGVLAVEFHSKLNTVGGDTLEMLHAGVKEAAANFSALVVGNDAPNFSAGANLMLLLLEAQEGNWDDIELMVRSFQGATQALRYADVPVVVCPAGLTLGGGCEIALHGDRMQAAAESYIGLVEAGVGLIPAGGGAKEMLARSVEGLRIRAPTCCRAFSGCSKPSASRRSRPARPTACALGFLRPVDAVTMNRERLMADAKAARARTRARRLPSAGAEDGDSRWRRRRARAAEARRASGVAGGPPQRSRRADRANARRDSRRRIAGAPDDGLGAVPAGSRTRSVPQTVRRAEDARADPAHAQNR